jgi:hypothetical protein
VESEEVLRDSLPAHVRDRFDQQLVLGDPLLANLLLEPRIADPRKSAVWARSRSELVAVGVAIVASEALREIRRAAGLPTRPPFGPGIHWVLERLAARSLPYTMDDAVILVRLARYPFWRSTIRLAISAAARMLEREGPRDDLIAGLRDLDRHFDEVDPLRAGKMADWRPKVRHLLIASDPGTVLVRAFGERDGFGPAAMRVVVNHFDLVDAQALIAHFCAPRGGRPSNAWWEATEQLIADNHAAAELLRELLELGTTVPLTTTTQETHGTYAGPALLFDDTNTFIVRGAVWAAVFVEAPWTVPTLSKLVLRCSATADGWWGVAPLAPKVSVAAIDTLGSIDDPTAGTELDELFNEVTLAATVRRIAAVRGIPEADVQARLASIRKQGRRRPRARGASGHDA